MSVYRTIGPLVFKWLTLYVFTLQDWAARYWRDNGTPADKLIIGLATYGRTFTLSNPSSNSMGAPARGAGSAGQKTGEAGFMAYYEVNRFRL